ncbi:N-acetylmuramoyl-L-alanine amidase, partial [Clostridioides difficile]
MKICITVGHSILKSGACTSANGVVNEYQYNKSLAPVLADTFRKEGHKADVIICPEKQFKTKSEEKSYKIPKVNSGGYDLLIELHLNSSGVGAFGTEVFYYSEKGKEYAQRVVDKLSKPFIRKKGDKEVGNRGVKLDKSLYILNSSKPTAILIESFFCDNKEDYEKAKKLGHEGIAKLIVEGVLNKNINNEGVKQMYKHTIIYDGEVDKIPATVVGWGYNDGKILICDIKD